MQPWRFLEIKFVIGTICLGAIVLLALLGGLVAGHDPNEQNLMFALEPPFGIESGYYLGTDHLGRDLLARMTSGARISLAIAGSVVVLSGVVGVLIGALSGYLAGARDAVIQKVVETFWAFPPILLAIAILAFFGPSLGNVIIALTIQRWIPYCRIARAQALMLRSREYISAAKIMGGGTGWILRHHVLPNLLASAIIIATFTMATAILAESSLSFLGLGVPPNVPTWGGMLAEGRSYITRAWWLAVLPGLGIFLTVLGLNLLGDWLRDQLDPKAALNLS
ncbi:peptide/nickel transport system permease protein [Bosea sp. BE271]|jgi:peptide/nickel transport system permease protein|uniref:Peptide ABC transporter permease n=2 Tax=Bosea TaxID=85413 RepID=A0A0Q3M6H1_9HYPH|nr:MULTISPECIES: ABC transporter permease [Bosea]MBD3847456.1 ABC transporter permease [Bosea spartocytisi]KQK31385.1 peptide ABC transporter permease [Bosea thiooxidans]MDR6830541.1 peptide/nickel transport system permease protein [Bosea robiniae]MDR6897422.1 peptide/nickel transport system permease protein [Bosea sp. BE109]MDR7140819.1 peptide/nickel transport system permease protein [Bosea sp. BE168]